MKAERWQQVKGLLEAALEREPEQRSAFLTTACASDESLRTEIENLIISHDRAGAFIEEPAFGVLADSLAGRQTESLIGRTLGHYAISALLGTGGMGEVYLAEDARLGRKVALKLLPPFFSAEDERVRRFQQEARAASALNHPNILTIYEIGKISATPFIATEFVEGDTLRTILKAGQISLTNSLDIAIQIAAALAAAHAAGIVHRDIKPENIMLRRDGIVKVLDFGLAKLVERETDGSQTATLLSTQSGMIMGTPSYMSPEQTRGLKVDGRTDIWSLGVLLYEMIGRRVPFAGKTSSDVIVSILQKKALPLARVAPETPPALQRIVNKALRKDLSRRYQAAKSLLADLHDLKRRLEFENEIGERRTGDRPFADAPAPRHLPRKTGRKRTLDSIAILPLMNTSADAEMEYLSDGVAENIIDNLSQLPALRVMAWRTVARYRRSDATPSEIGQALGVRTVLSGSLRQIGQQLIVRAELVDAKDGAQVWSDHYDRKAADILTVQEEVAREISEKLRLRLTGEERSQLARRQTDNIDAYHAYLKGRYYWNKRATGSLKQGAEYFRQAIDLDPNYAAAYAGLSDAYTLLVVRETISPDEGFAKAKAAAARALEIDKDFAQARASLGHAMLHNWEWAEGERQLRRAIEFNPNYPSAHHWYSEHLTAMGRCEESIAELKLAAELDPLSLIISADLGRAFYYARQYDQVLKQEARTLEMDSNFWLSHINIGRAFTQTGKHSEAIAELRKAHELSVGNSEALSFLGFAYAAAGKKDEALKTLNELNEQAKQNHVPPYHFAIVYAGLGENKLALEWLDRAFAKHSVDLFTLKVEPMLDSLRADPRFSDLVRRTGLQLSESSRFGHSRKQSSSRKRSSRTTIKSLAILPLENTSVDPSMEYLSDGITESIINILSQFPKVRIVARNTVFRYKGREFNFEEVGRALKVQAVLTGRVHLVADRLIIGVELVDIDTASQLWGETYSRNLSDVFEVQAEIAKEIADKLRVKLSGAEKERLSRRYTDNTEAYRIYLKGRYHWNKRTFERLQKGIECFEQAIAIDPSYALAYAGISDCYAFQGDVGLAAVPSRDAFANAKRAAAQALAIDSTLADAYVSLAHVNMHNFEWAEAEAAFKSALKLNVNHAQAHQWYAFYLLFNSQPDKAIAEVLRALELDPLSLTAHGDLGQIFHYTRQYDRAIEAYQKVLDLEPNHTRTYLWLGWTYEQKSMYEAAIEAFHRAFSEESTEPLASLGCVYALAGRTEEAREVLKQLQEISAQRYVSPYHLALLLVNLGHEHRALQSLEQAYAQRAEWMIYLSVDPRFDRLRTNSHFADLVRRIGFRTTAKTV